ncbi:hypothetical protein PTTG_11933 [Puccinia triticina 1-1 BBBD Race 1]|uniref:Uncharacterized protein n=1 Tax=Puccinia triticina (isolate 1-1 / race 1 (BBBD)) TaxID=630390 RepID=A0A180H3Q5_PUCT1|nr:hypothetical protein PTTG_11933 [Puccinia triticina 1-1 BBBD Race 1]
MPCLLKLLLLFQRRLHRGRKLQPNLALDFYFSSQNHSQGQLYLTLPLAFKTFSYIFIAKASSCSQDTRTGLFVFHSLFNVLYSGGHHITVTDFLVSQKLAGILFENSPGGQGVGVKNGSGF